MQFLSFLNPKRWLSSLDYHVKHNVWSWRRTNPIVRRVRYNRLHALAISGSRHLVLSLVLLFGGSVLASALIAAIQPLVPGSWAFWNTPEDPSGPLGVVWTIQVTLAAVVYPIVIGFVALMFQQQPTANLRLAIFLEESTAKLSGLSSLMLCLVSAIQWLLAWHFRAEVVMGWLLFDTGWLAVNIAGSMLFLYRAFEVLKPETADAIIRRYAIDVIWRLEVAESLRSLILTGAPTFGLVPRPPRDDAMALMHGAPAVWFSPLMLQSGQECVAVRLHTPRAVADVWFRPLGWVIRRWLKRVDDTERPAGARRGAALYFPAFVGNLYEEQLDLCRVEGPPVPTPFERRIIRLSYRLSRKATGVAGTTVGKLLQELAGEVLDDIEKRQELRANDRLDGLVELHADIIKAGEFTDKDGNKDNYALLPMNRVTSIPLVDRWARIYIDIFEAAAAKIPESPAYFNHASQVATDLFRGVMMLRKTAVGDRAIHMARIAMLRLGAWWIRTIEQEQGAQPHACRPTWLEPYTRRSYKALLDNFVGSWEQLGKHYFNYGARNRRAPWSDLQLTAHFQMTHLSDTVLMFFDAVARGDQQAAEAITDSLKQWTPSMQLEAHMDSYLVRTPLLLTMSLMDGEEAQLRSDVEVRDFPSLRRDFVEAVMAVIFDNLWTDHFVVAACCLVLWGKECDCDSSLPALFLPHYLRERSDSVMVRGSNPQLFSIGKVFWSLVRQHLANRDYEAQVGALAEKIQEMRAPPMIPGRIYSRFGASDLDSLIDGQLVVLCLLQVDAWDPAKGHEREISQLLSDGLDRGPSIDHWVGRMIDRLQHPEFKERAAFFGCVAPELGQKLPFTEVISALVNSLTLFRTAAQQAHTATIQQAPIDPAAVEEAAGWANQKAFSKDTAASPVFLFGKIESTVEVFAERSFTLAELDRGEFTSPRRSVRPSGEDDVFASYARDVVGAAVIYDVLQQLAPVVQERATPTSAAYWNELKLAAAVMVTSKLTPVLLVENPMTPKWIYDWTVGFLPDRELRPDDLQLTRREGFDANEYIGHFNDIEVYRVPGLPAGASFVVARQALAKLEFHAYGPNRLATVIPVEREDKPTKLNMRIVWQQRITLEALPAFKLLYGEIPDQ